MIALTSGIENGPSRQRVNTIPNGQPIPFFNLLLTDGVTRINTAAIPPGSPIVLLLFSPECSCCCAEMDAIVPNMKSLAGIRFYFVTPCPLAEIRQFSLQYHLDKYTNVVVGMDIGNFFLLYTRASVIPYHAVYDNHKRLKEIVAGQTTDRRIKEIAFQ